MKPTEERRAICLAKGRIKGKVLIIELPLEEPKRSHSGKTDVIASTHGFRRIGVQVEGKDVFASINAAIYHH
jgi:hypothetical protein